jgi:hypothetical protein
LQQIDLNLGQKPFQEPKMPADPHLAANDARKVELPSTAPANEIGWQSDRCWFIQEIGDV